MCKLLSSMSFSVEFDRSLSFRVIHYYPQGVTNILSLFQNAKKLRMGKINVTAGRWAISKNLNQMSTEQNSKLNVQKIKCLSKVPK